MTPLPRRLAEGEDPPRGRLIVAVTTGGDIQIGADKGWRTMGPETAVELAVALPTLIARACLVRDMSPEVIEHMTRAAQARTRAALDNTHGGDR